MTIGSARPALEIAANYTTKRKAFGTTINNFQGVNFQVAEAATLLDACRSMIYTTACAVDRKADPHTIRRMVSESKKFVTEACQKVAHNSMQIMGGIGYTDVYPIERALRDTRLGMIWTGTTQIMNLMIQHEYYNEILAPSYDRRIMEDDATNPDITERCFTDEDMTEVFDGKILNT